MQLVSKILETHSYKIVYLLLGSIILVFSLTISLFIAKRPLQSYKKSKELFKNNKDASSNKKSLNFSTISASPSFWHFSIGLFLFGISFAGIKQHYQTYLSFFGLSS